MTNVAPGTVFTDFAWPGLISFDWGVFLESSVRVAGDLVVRSLYNSGKPSDTIHNTDSI